MTDRFAPPDREYFRLKGTDTVPEGLVAPSEMPKPYRPEDRERMRELGVPVLNLIDGKDEGLCAHAFRVKTLGRAAEEQGIDLPSPLADLATLEGRQGLEQLVFISDTNLIPLELPLE
ncbi:MAG TPA: hypothetical protein VK674_02870 [Candidatus Limnocylindria bacterium]|nr:hypothetical protein [Candidatus Limnocylindria bacterium]